MIENFCCSSTTSKGHRSPREGGVYRVCFPCQDIGVHAWIWIGPMMKNGTGFGGDFIVRASNQSGNFSPGFSGMFAPCIVSSYSIRQSARSGRFEKVGWCPTEDPSAFCFEEEVGRDYVRDGWGQRVPPESGVVVRSGFVSYNLFDCAIALNLGCPPCGYILRMLEEGSDVEWFFKIFHFVDRNIIISYLNNLIYLNSVSLEGRIYKIIK